MVMKPKKIGLIGVVAVAFVLVVIGVSWLLWLVAHLFVVLWADLTPKFGINVPLEEWDVIKLAVLSFMFRWFYSPIIIKQTVKKK